jgi:hypothetical protein
MQSGAFPNSLEGNMFHVSHTMIRRLTVLAAVLVAVAVVSPLASAKRRTALPCQITPAQWISVDNHLGTSALLLVSATRCTAGTEATVDGCAAGQSPYPGWVQLTDDLGIPYLVPTGSGAAAPGCAVGSSASTVKATQSLTEPLRTKSRYPGWVYVYDGNGVPTLEAISSYR